VLQGTLGRLIIGVGAFELGNAAATLLILRATELLTPSHGHAAAVKIALALYAGYNLAATLIAIPAGHLSDGAAAYSCSRSARQRSLPPTSGLAVVGASIATLAVLFAAAGVGIGVGETAQSAAVAAFAPVAVRGSAFGLVSAIQAFANLTASAIAGVVWTTVSPDAGFLYLAAWSVVALLAFTAAGRVARSCGSLRAAASRAALGQ